ncbi:hypothetical protein C8R47DRAFT_1235090 [Mycena vitilis]|nr:hypothetical protein C8R47DRAFT_1235090 [Mycena vitilis]
MANSTSDGSNLDLFIVDQVLFARRTRRWETRKYLLVQPPAKSPRIQDHPLGRRRSSSKPSEVSTGRTLRKVSTIVFLALTVLQAGQTLWFFKDSGSSTAHSWGHRHGRYFLRLISVFMLVREIFVTAMMNNSTGKQNDERLWYPLVALPEFLAVVCYVVSGLVPTRAAPKEFDTE